jgi:hypothetical protein
MSPLICFGVATAVTSSKQSCKALANNLLIMFTANTTQIPAFHSPSTEKGTAFLTLGATELTQGSDELVVQQRRPAPPRLPRLLRLLLLVLLWLTLKARCRARGRYGGRPCRRLR